MMQFCIYNFRALLLLIFVVNFNCCKFVLGCKLLFACQVL